MQYSQKQIKQQFKLVRASMFQKIWDQAASFFFCVNNTKETNSFSPGT